MFPLIAFSTAVHRWERRLPARFRHFRASEEDILPNLIFLANLFWNFAIFPFLILDRVDLPTLCRHSLGVAALAHCTRLCEFYCLTYEICDWTKKGDDLFSLADCWYVASSSNPHFSSVVTPRYWNDCTRSICVPFGCNPKSSNKDSILLLPASINFVFLTFIVPITYFSEFRFQSNLKFLTCWCVTEENSIICIQNHPGLFNSIWQAINVHIK